MIPQHRTLQIFGSPNRTQAPPSFVHSRCSMAKSESTFSLGLPMPWPMRAWHACVHTWRACALAWMRILLCLLSLSTHACTHGVHARMPGRAYCCVCYACPCLPACVHSCMRECMYAIRFLRAQPPSASAPHACVLACMHGVHAHMPECA